MARFRFFWARGFLCCVGVFCVLVDERVFWCVGDFFNQFSSQIPFSPFLCVCNYLFIGKNFFGLKAKQSKINH